ncbi:MAG: hypothetical protein QXG39_06385 [Candidatus Aenigmatarchaeota archaeon]
MVVYVLNALIPPTSGLGLLKVSPATVEEVKRAIASGAQCYIGHPATARLLNVAPNRGEAKPQAGDVAFVLRLRFRPAQSGQEVEVRESDLEVLRVEYLSAEALHALSVQGLK